MRRLPLTIAAAVLVTACAPDRALAPDAGARLSAPPEHSDAGGRKDVKVMTRNLYLGASLQPITSATSFPEIVIRGAAVWGIVQASDIPARMDRIADEIAEEQPHAVGLQEVSIWRTQSPGDAHLGGSTPAATVAYDFLDLLVTALESRGQRYIVAAAVTNVDAELPILTASGFMDVRLTDRDVILVREDVETRNARSAQYVSRVVIPALGLSTPRGWNSVEVKHRGEWFRLVNTHLEIEENEAVQVQQAAELRDLLAAESLPIVLVGDINSDGEEDAESTTPSYALLRAGGFADAWTEANPGDPGFTSGHAENLRNPASNPTKRIDVIFHRGAVSSQRAVLVGGDPAKRTAAGLWPSDHLGIVATLRLENPPPVP